jgi:hypothetical protein
VWPGSSRDTRTLPSLVFKLYIEQILSKPPHATKLPDGAYAHVMTHDERNGMACTYKLKEMFFSVFFSLTNPFLLAKKKRERKADLIDCLLSLHPPAVRSESGRG